MISYHVVILTACGIVKVEVTAEDADRVIGEVASVVTNLDQEEEQTEDNVELIANVFGQIDTLIGTGNLSVDISVRNDIYFSVSIDLLLLQFVDDTASVVSDISSWPPQSLEEQSSM